ncbi:FecR family protein [Sphingobacterium yanglingense]|uniref:FecR family protein n=1 Tax=Sphingobacterium yanglingense TaxID=1437280 RepID=A0A4R6WEP8_9SPHI|nr:FecR family protein [Sphingobacterium yanglingense]TDQ78289.1 FecR family protein [Sphingobacterium yanglingense]
MDEKDKQELLKRYLAGECTSQERLQVEQWYELLSKEEDSLVINTTTDLDHDIDEVRFRLLSSLHYRRKWYTYASIAAIFVGVFIAAYLYFTQLSFLTIEDTKIIAETSPDIFPGGQVAVLQLEDGTEIPLEGVSNGVIATGNNHTVYKKADGQLDYIRNQEGNVDRDKSITNTLKTPRGGQYQLNLPDGSKVWLNAASQLTYTIDNNRSDRVVDLHGEAYFEVAKDQSKPFKVRSKGQIVEVLGTHFNVSSYDDDPSIKTTLSEGAVRVTETISNKTILLEPGQQSTLDRDHRLTVDRVNVLDAIAWKNGKFSFNQSDIYAVVRQLSRWYNVEVVFKGKAKNVHLSGEVHRNTNASTVLEILSFYNLNCKIESVDGVKRIIIE